MLKKGDKVYFFQTMNRIGTVVNIITEKNNQLTVGGTSEARVYVDVLYNNDDNKTETIRYRKGDIQKYFD